MNDNLIKKLLVISSPVFLVSFLLLLVLISKLNEYNYFYPPIYNNSLYSFTDTFQKLEKQDYYDTFLCKVNYDKYEILDEDKDNEKILAFNTDEAINNMTEVKNIRITESNYEDEDKNRVKIYKDKDSSLFTVLKSYNNYQFYNSYHQRPEKYLDFIEDNENNHKLIFVDSILSDNESRLYFSNYEMNLINGSSQKTIYDMNYLDVSFDCDNLPVKIVYNLKDNSIKETSVFCITNNGKEPENYNLDSSIFYDSQAAELFSKAIKEKKDFEENGIKVSYNGKFKLSNGYSCYVVSIVNRQ